MKYLEVAVLARTKENFDTFTYSLPKEIKVNVGQVVKVSLRNKNVYAVILNFTKKPSFSTKEILETTDIVIPKHLVNTAKWMSEYYLASIDSVLRTILPAGFYKKRRQPAVGSRRSADKNTADCGLRTADITLTPDQQAVLNQINKSKNSKPFLLYGVTGSGKTEIYMRLIAKEIKKGNGSAVLVPEIALTPQTIQRFEKRFPGEVTVLHSYLKETGRQKNWNDIKDGKKKIVVGSRSAIFAPFNNLGLIIIDEEHEISYKQEMTPKYDAIKIAEKIAEETGARLILGSATPQIESFYKAKAGAYNFLELLKRISGNKMPEVSVVDLRKEFKGGNKSIFSLKLQEVIEKTLKEKKQIILFLNRRGSATYVFCRDCGYVEECPNCGIPLVQHLVSSQQSAVSSKALFHKLECNPADCQLPTASCLLCHHCSFKKPVPSKCPICQSYAIKYQGIGTQKVESEIKAMFPKAKVSRMDKDTVLKRGSHENIYNDFAKKKIDVLIGTQMIAKGWDIQSVDLIGIILADTGLFFPDFRSEERTFQLLTQVSGRPGRGKDTGKVIIQTYNPDNFSILAAKDHDFKKFYEREIKSREALNYPPFNRIVKFEYSNSDPKKAEEEAEKFAKILNKYFTHIIGPSPSFIPKQKSKYFWQILIKFDGNLPKDLVKLIPKGWVVDIDPKNTL